MLNSTQTRPHISNSPEILGGGNAAVGMGAVLSLDQLQGSRARRELRSYPEFYTTQENNHGDTLGFLPGCQVDGSKVHTWLRSHIVGQNIIVVGYPERTFDIEQICEGIGRQFEIMRAHKPKLICPSMGGIALRHMLEYAEQSGLAERTEGFGNIVLDDSIHDYADVRSKYRLLLKGATSARNSWIADKLKPTIMNRITKSDHSLSLDTHIETIASEGAFIMRNDHPDGTYDHLVDSVYYVHGPNGDNVARTEQAVEKYKLNFPASLIEIIDPSRGLGSHTGGEGQIDLMLQYANNEPIIPKLTEQQQQA